MLHITIIIIIIIVIIIIITTIAIIIIIIIISSSSIIKKIKKMIIKNWFIRNFKNVTLNFNFVMVYTVHKILVLLKDHLNYLKDNALECYFKKYNILLFYYYYYYYYYYYFHNI